MTRRRPPARRVGCSPRPARVWSLPGRRIFRTGGRGCGCAGARAGGGAGSQPARGSRSPNRSRKSRRGCVRRAGCAGRSPTRWPTTGVSARRRPAMGCPGRPRSARSRPAPPSRPARRRRRRCWASMRRGGNGPGGCGPPTAGGGAPTRGKPSSSTWRPGRAWWVRSAGGPGPAWRCGWPSRARRSGTRSVSSRWTRRRPTPRRCTGCCRRPPWWSTTSTWCSWPTGWSRRSGSGSPAAAGPAGPVHRPGVGEPADAAAGPGTALRAGVHPDVERRGRQRPVRAVAGGLDRQRGAAGAAGLRGPRRAAPRHRPPAHPVLRLVRPADIPEVTTLAQTVETWWPELLAFLQTGITNAGTEGTNRLVKQVLRCACGFRNKNNYRMRVRLHCARQRASARAQPAES